MRPITGTHVYTYAKCSRAVALDFHGDRDRRRPLRPEEEFVLQRGRDHEATYVETLGWPEPEYDTRDFEHGAKATESMLRDGVAGVSQGVLLGDGKLGIPDLLRRVDGESALGRHHYVVGDVKSSGRPRSDQVLQVAFYSELLARLQERAPEYGYLILKDGTEERFELEPFEPALREVVAAVERLRRDPDAARPFLARACETCRWSELCSMELTDREDLSLLPGMTRGVREMLEAGGIATCYGLAAVPLDDAADRTRLEHALLRQLKVAAAARDSAQPVIEAARSQFVERRAACLHFLFDPFEDRVCYMGLLRGTGAETEVRSELPASRDSEWRAFTRLVAGLPAGLPLLHYGPTVPRWYEDRSHGRSVDVNLERCFVDAARQLRGAAVYPAPVFGFDGHVRYGLERDPHRAGRADAAAMHASDREWLMRKGESDLRDLAELKSRWLEESVEE